MTIDEAMKKIKEKMACDYNISGCDTCDISSCEDRDIIIQLAEWLEELKALKNNSISIEAFERMKSKSYKKGHRQGYNKALDDIVTIIKERVGMDWEWDFCFIEQIAEQLKAGGKYRE